MNWEKATDEQLKVIIEDDGGVPPRLLAGVYEEVVRRNLYEGYFYSMLTKRFITLRYAVRCLKTPFEDLLQIFYIAGFQALKKFKPGKNAFLTFWARFAEMEIKTIKRDSNTQKRSAYVVSVDAEDVYWELPSDMNVEKTVVNRITVEELLSILSVEERAIVLMRNEDYTFVEIGRQMGYARDTIRMKYNKALAKMRKGA